MFEDLSEGLKALKPRTLHPRLSTLEVVLPECKTLTFIGRPPFAMAAFMLRSQSLTMVPALLCLGIRVLGFRAQSLGA